MVHYLDLYQEKINIYIDNLMKMKKYLKNEILRVAKRYNNNKRTFLLVNTLQAKHIPVRPTESLEMMDSLANIVAEKYHDTKLVIGFAETATAIGAVVAQKLSKECVYITTTRENIQGVNRWIVFQEEHSHATEQKLVSDNLEKLINNTDSIIFVDDEYSTGKTLINIVNQLRELFPAINTKKLIAVSIFNRLSVENTELMINNNIKMEWLVKLENEDYEKMVHDISVSQAPLCESYCEALHTEIISCPYQLDLRKGVVGVDYKNICEKNAEKVYKHISGRILIKDKVLVAGTEEFMYPAIIIGKKLEEEGFLVKTHSTTRSPIGIADVEGYPFRNGFRLESFYDVDRITYIYNTEKYDVIIVVSDSIADNVVSLQKFVNAFDADENTKVFYVKGGIYE